MVAHALAESSHKQSCTQLLKEIESYYLPHFCYTIQMVEKKSQPLLTSDWQDDLKPELKMPGGRAEEEHTKNEHGRCFNLISP